MSNNEIKQEIGKERFVIYKTYYHSPLGEILLVSDGENLTGVSIEGQKCYLGDFIQEAIEKDDLAIFIKTKRWLNQYFNKEKPEISELSLAPVGNEFRQNVWKILCQIPYGKTVTYGEIAKQIMKEMNKKSMSAQAIGNAVGNNPIAIIIPCHRVVGKNGNLTGYAGGIEKKIKLLEIEGINMQNFFYA